MEVIAGDIGGTKTWLRISRCNKDGFDILYEQRFASGSYDNFDDVLTEFFKDAAAAGVRRPQKICLGVAGPVDSGFTKVTNLPWLLEEKKLIQNFGFSHVRLINDFQAIAYGIETLTDDETIILQQGESHPHLPCVVIGAGTGLGQVIMVWRGDNSSGCYEAWSSEGGHADFAPGSQEQRELVSFLARRQARVSVEDVLSGRGLVNIYHFMADCYPDEVNEDITNVMAMNDAAATISEAALTNTDKLASKALDLFVSVYGNQAGNLALTCLAKGGVYIAGGVAPRIKDRMLDRAFLQAFSEKGPMALLMKNIPVKLITNLHVGVQGAALVASRL